MRRRTRARSHVSLVTLDQGAKYADVKDYTQYIEKAMTSASNAVYKTLSFKNQFKNVVLLAKDEQFITNLNSFSNEITKTKHCKVSLDGTIIGLEKLIGQFEDTNKISNKHENDFKIYTNRINDASKMPFNFKTKHEIWAKENFLASIFDIITQLNQNLAELAQIIDEMIVDTKNFLQIALSVKQNNNNNNNNNNTNNNNNNSEQGTEHLTLTNEMIDMISKVENGYKIFTMFCKELKTIKQETTIIGASSTIQFDLDKQVIVSSSDENDEDDSDCDDNSCCSGNNSNNSNNSEKDNENEMTTDGKCVIRGSGSGSDVIRNNKIGVGSKYKPKNKTNKNTVIKAMGDLAGIDKMLLMLGLRTQ